jgi:hypothetical protein
MSETASLTGGALAPNANAADLRKAWHHQDKRLLWGVPPDAVQFSFIAFMFKKMAPTGLRGGRCLGYSL